LPYFLLLLHFQLAIFAIILFAYATILIDAFQSHFAIIIFDAAIFISPLAPDCYFRHFFTIADIS
jgi:hypothetical protein